jgi:FAD/FMN-containing dehydrogenase
MATTSTQSFDIPGFGGELIHPDHSAYDEARAVFNGMIDRRPAVIARCASTDDVVAAVNFARDQDLPLSVYGGGHAVTGSAVVDAGVCIDLRGMKQIEVDPSSKTARCAGGCTWGEFDAATQEHGLAVTGGRVPSTGVAGLALGSGSGWLERKFGFTCDNLLEAEVVTADGRVVTASASENPDLFWGLRGGGGNFGIVTRFTFQLHDVGPLLLAGLLIFPAERAVELLRFWRDWVTDASDEVGSAVAFITAPPAPFVPEPVRGHPIVAVVVAYAGSVEDGEAALQPLRDLGPAVDLVEPMPYVALQGLIEPGNPHGLQNWWTADFLEELPDEAIDTLVERATAPVSPHSQVLLAAGGGAIARVPDDATAFGQRHAPFNVHFLSMWEDPADEATNIAYTRDIAGAMKQWTTGQVYLNYIGDEGAARVEQSFGDQKWDKLRALKAVWDPDNLFHHNQNIPPA